MLPFIMFILHVYAFYLKKSCFHHLKLVTTTTITTVQVHTSQHNTYKYFCLFLEICNSSNTVVEQGESDQGSQTLSTFQKAE